MHALAPEPDDLPATHAMQSLALEFDHVPPSHLVHALLPASEYEAMSLDQRRFELAVTGVLVIAVASLIVRAL